MNTQSWILLLVLAVLVAGAFWWRMRRKRSCCDDCESDRCIIKTIGEKQRKEQSKK